MNRNSLTPQEAERLVNTYSDLILRLSYTYLRETEDAKDICQTVFLKLLEQPRSFDSPDHEKAWIIRAAINTCKDLLKSHWRRTSLPLDAAAMSRPPCRRRAASWRPCRCCPPSTGWSSISTTTRATPPGRWPRS